MVAFKYVGYREATIQKREMTVGELRHRLCKSYLKKPDKVFIIMSLDDGQRIEIKSMEEAIEFDWCDSCWIEVINTPHRWGCMEDDGSMEKDAPTIILIQESEKETGNNTVL